MDLDARRIKNPFEEMRKKELDECVTKELSMLQRKIMIATELGLTSCFYTVQPSLRFPNTEDIIKPMMKTLKDKNFTVEEAAYDKIWISWST